MRRVTKRRKLSAAELTMGKSVFGSSVPWKFIRITDGLGPIPGFDHPYADRNPTFSGVDLNLGPRIYPDATKTVKLAGYGRYRDVFIHELTHAWQYARGYWVVSGSVWANTLGSGYSYVPGDPWHSYNVEQQAELVMDWFAGGMSSTDPRFIYIKKIVRPAAKGLLPLYPAKYLRKI